MAISLNRADINFLLRQVTVNYLIPDGNGGFVASDYFNYSALANALDPSGLREVAGSNNNLVGGYWDATIFNPVTGQNGIWVPGPNTSWGQAQQPFLNLSVGQHATSAPVIDYNNPGNPVSDADPRMISNLVATMFTSGPNANPAALLAATNGDPNADFGGLQVNGTDTAFVANAGVLGGGRYNGWFVAFGQFFDHGLDFVSRDSDPTATVTVALSPVDPLYDADGANNVAGDFDDVTAIQIRRADVANASDAGGDGIFGTMDDAGLINPDGSVLANGDEVFAKPKYINQTGLLIDQSQTYGSHQSVNALLREYTATGEPTGRMVTGNTSALTDGDPGNNALANGLATWADVKANALRIGVILNDTTDLHNAPVLRVDPTGRLMYAPNPGENYDTSQIVGFNPAAQDPNDPFMRDALGNVLRTGQNMLIDSNPGIPVDQHIITGDGRGNENIGLTSVHHVFHEEHNALVGTIQAQIMTEYNAILANEGAAAASAFIGPWQSAPGVWDGERLFQAARLITESEYNHIAIDQYIGTLYGALPEFVSYSSDINMGVSLEFSQAVFRLGHSMLTETFDVIDPNTGQPLKLLDMFLNPTLYQQIGPTALAQGLTQTLGNEVDEFVTPALQQSLLGQPLDLATINIARGRDVNLPTWNEFRDQLYKQYIQNTNNTNSSALAPYTSWSDVFDHLKNPLTGVNLIAAYGRDTGGSFDWGLDEARAAYNAGTATIQDLRTVAQALYDAYLNTADSNHDNAVTFMEGTPTYNTTTGQWEFLGADQGFWDIDLWIGGLAERPLFDGPLGTTFSYVILDFAQRQQDGDRFYYLYRTPMGTHLGNEIIQNQFGNLVADNTGLQHVNGEVFIREDARFELDGIDADGLGPDVGLTSVDANSDINDYFNAAQHTIFDVEGNEMPASFGHIVVAGNEGHDFIIAGLGDDTVYGDDGNDTIQGSQGNDHLFGGDGDDLITDDENDDFISGGAGNDRIFAGGGALDTVFGDEGDDELHGGDGIDEVLGGTGDDMIYGDGDTDVLFGDDGNDYVDGGDSVDEMQGQAGNDWMRGGVGDDHLIGGDGNDLLEGGIGPTANDGDRLVGQGVIDFAPAGTAEDDLGFDVASYEDVDIAITANLDTSNDNGTGGLLDTYAGIDGLVGGRFNDNLTGGDPNSATVNGTANLLVGGGGNDVLTGLGGDDIIVGDQVAVHSDFTIDSAFDSTVTNWKGTGDDRPDYGIGAAVDLGHFLGENGAAGTDTAVFRGNLADYDFEVITYGGYQAVQVTDTRDPAAETFDGTDILIGMDKAQFADQTVTLIPPVLDLHAFDVAATGQYRDEFTTPVLNGSNGTTSWSGTPWVESGDNGNTNSATAGQITIDLSNNNALRFGDNDADTGNGTATIQRTVNLSGVTNATLSYSFNENSFDSGEVVTVTFAADGVNFNQIIQTINGNSGSGTTSVALTGPFSANAAIRFVVSGTNNNSSGDSVTIDNVNIATVTLAPVIDGNNYTTSFTEPATSANGTPVVIASFPNIIDDSANMQSAKIVLTNAKAGDVLNANAISGDGITVTTDTSVAGLITINLSGNASKKAYLDQIQAITFASISHNPDTTDRIINVTVNDGIFDSNVAITTVHVVASDDPVDATNDTLVTNFGTGVAFVVPEWAFLANDVDPEDVIDITAVGLASGLTASLVTNPGSITITDTGSSNGSFAYTATAGLTGDIASVSVTQDAGDISTGGGSQILVGNNNGNTYSSGSGNDIILAGAGNDELDGGSGADILQGGAGFDDFNFDDGDTGVGAGNRDVILDFLGGGGAEDIDLSLIDAISGGGDSTFSNVILSMTTNFTGNGQLRYQQIDTDGNATLDSTLILGNVTGGAGGSAAADLEILLKGYIGTIVAGDFIL